MVEVKVSERFRQTCPHFVGASVLAKVKNSEYAAALWQQIDSFSANFEKTMAMEDIKRNKAIAATRQAYKSFGKDPNRYRPSSEALMRRILKQMPLYKINTLVDIINLVSLHTGYSIGGFDSNKFNGTELTLDIGEAGEPYEGIGKGMLNIEGLPVYRDALGGVGTPTSDNERTKIDLKTTSVFTIINGYGGHEGLDDAVILMQDLLKEFAEAADIQVKYF